jgi:ATP-binding protein involved in chromosome partitioning
VTFRTYNAVTGPDASGLLQQVLQQRARVAERLAGVERVTVVLSGKGGVGKSWITAALALAVQRLSLAVGVVDADLHSPTIVRLLGGSGDGRLVVHEDGVTPVTTASGVRVVSTDLLLEEGRALHWRTEVGESHTWRGAAEANVLREFFADVAWGRLAMLFVDMPPDTSRLDDLATLLDWRDRAGGVPRFRAIAVTIPSDESARSVARALDAAARTGLPVLGIVENMSGTICPGCGRVGKLFHGNAAERLAAESGLPVLARVPFSGAPVEQVAQHLAPVAARLLRTAAPPGTAPVDSPLASPAAP